ncbi:MAG: hypothetical protein CBE43_06780 [Rhodopirellula sp. TMED283]|nr:MAG: hypothetical protein CBE43_06780 [Rhodopirellula sp. TMED283]
MILLCKKYLPAGILFLICMCMITTDVTISQVSAEPAKSRNGDASANPTDILDPLSERFAKEDTSEVPDFQKHVIPLLSRLGCNGRACHGSFQGRGGFQLSLFGYDFKTDHDALLDDSAGRVDVDDVAESLILSKPSDAELHEGGKRFEKGTWQHHVLQRWVEAGASYDSTTIHDLDRVDVSPAEIMFHDENEILNLTVVAHWKDGTSEDVTELCRFSSNNDAIADIDDAGQIKSGDRGDTHVVVYYDKAVIPVPVLRPVGISPISKFAKPKHAIDRLVQEKLNKLGIVPSGICTDAEFIRRVSLDISGILPDASAVREFLADDSPLKREKLIERLLDSPGYAAWWATRFSDWTGNSDEQLQNVFPIRNAATRLWYEWLRVRLENNMPYDDIVEGIVAADNRQPEEDYVTYSETMTEACKPGNEELFAKRDGLPMFWGRRNFQKPEERAIGFAYTFLGVRIECAQCHKHPFDQWSKNDFERFSKLFTPIRYTGTLVAKDAKQVRQKLLDALTDGKKLKGGDLRRAVQKGAQQGKTVPFGELVFDDSSIQRLRKSQAKRKGGKSRPVTIPSGKILGEKANVTLDADPRDALMAWLRSADNPYFAKAIINRVWSNYFGDGIVSPTDDMNLANPPVNEPLMNHLASEFIKHEYDLKWLHRKIVTSETYQRSADTNATNAMDRTNFSHHVPRRLPAEVVYDAVILATGSDSQANKLRTEVHQMAIAEGKPKRRNQQDFALEVFGQSMRESNCDCDRSDAPSLLQSIYLRNDADMHKRLSDNNGWVAQACSELGVQGPRNSVDPRAAIAQKRAENYRKQFLARIDQYHKMPLERQAKAEPLLQRDHKRLVSKLKAYKFKVPKLSVLLKDKNAWPELNAPASLRSPAKTLGQLIEEAYLRTLSRYPDPQETEISVAFIEESKTPADGVQSLLWALVNTKEFILSH